MTVNNIPSTLQNAIQTGTLEREFIEPLKAQVAFRDIADRETIPNGVGETVTKTKLGHFPTVTADMSDTSNADLDNGLTPEYLGDEQYTISMVARGHTTDLNVVTSRVAIASIFLANAREHGDQARRSLDTMAARKLFDSYQGGNTRVKTTLGALGPVVVVDDIRGFTVGQNVVVGANTYVLSGITPDTSGTVSTAVWGKPGSLTFSTNVSVANGTAGKPVVASTAPLILRPNARATTGDLRSADYMTVQMVLQAKAQLEANCVPKMANGFYRMYGNPQHIATLHSDPDFKSYLVGKSDSAEFRRGVIANIMGVEVVQNSMNPVQANFALADGSGTQGAGAVGAVHRAWIGGQGALVEGVFTRTGYEGAEQALGNQSEVNLFDDIAYVVREPMDRLKQKVAQSWQYIGGFAVPTDLTVDPTNIPSASNAALKRGILIESVI